MLRKFLTFTIFLFFGFFVFPLFSYVCAEELSLENSGNGAGSKNEVVIEINRETTVESSSEANIENEVDMEANTGENTAEANVGDVSVETGDIIVDVEIVNDVNEASVEVEVCCCGGCESGPRSVVGGQNFGNGASSQNSIEISVEESVTVEDHKEANIQNSVAIDPNTGGNSIVGNVGGANLRTGDIDISVAIGNEANENEAHIGGPPCEEPEEPEEPNGGPGEPEPEEPSENGEVPSEPEEPAKPYEEPRLGPSIEGGEILALAAAIGAPEGQVLPITGPCEWIYILAFLLFLMSRYSRRLSYRYLYS